MHTLLVLNLVGWIFILLASIAAAQAFSQYEKRWERRLAYRDEKIAMLQRHMAERLEHYRRYQHMAHWIQDDRDAAEARVNELEGLLNGSPAARCRAVARLTGEVEKLKKEVDQLHVQLAGCGVAALGGTSPEQVAKRGQYGWSPSYQDVLDLRRRYENVKRLLHPDTIRSIERTPGA